MFKKKLKIKIWKCGTRDCPKPSLKDGYIYLVPDFGAKLTHTLKELATNFNMLSVTILNHFKRISKEKTW